MQKAEVFKYDSIRPLDLKNTKKNPCAKFARAKNPKWPLPEYCEKTKKGQIINDTICPTFLGPRTQIKLLFGRFEVKVTP